MNSKPPLGFPLILLYRFWSAFWQWLMQSLIAWLARFNSSLDFAFWTLWLMLLISAMEVLHLDIQFCNIILSFKLCPSFYQSIPILLKNALSLAGVFKGFTKSSVCRWDYISLGTGVYFDFVSYTFKAVIIMAFLTHAFCYFGQIDTSFPIICIASLFNRWIILLQRKLLLYIALNYLILSPLSFQLNQL